MSEYLGPLLLFTLLLCCSAFFSASEAALFSLGQVRLRHLTHEGHPRAALLEQLLAQPRRLLVTILVGNELVNIGASIVVATFWDTLLGHEHGFWAVTVLSISTALPFILFFGEILPKTLAVRSTVAIAVRVSRPLYYWGQLIAPLRWVLRGLADLLARPFGGSQAPSREAMTEQDLRALLVVGEREGAIDADEHKWIRNVMAFDEVAIHKVMTPLGDVTALPTTLSLSECVERVRDAGYSRIPIYDRKPERVVGILFAKDLLPHARGGASATPPALTTLMRPALFVPRSLSAAEVFRELRARRTHVALVVDEFGALVGLVTMEDLLEELVGEIADERDRDEQQGGRRPIRPVARAHGAPPPPPRGEAAR